MRIEGSRRQFVGGAVATGAVVGGAMFWGRGATIATADDVIRVVPGRSALAALPPIDPAEVDRWTALVGRPIQIAGARGSIASVQRVASDGPRPAGVRREGFTVTFLLDRATAPVGDAMYDVGVAIDGLSRLFLIRGADRGTAATFMAHFN